MRTWSKKMQELPKKQRVKNHTKTVRIDYAANHQKIESFILGYVKENARLPTRNQIVEAVGFSPSTVQSHMKTLNIKSFMHQYRNLSPRVMMGLFSRAANGNPNAAKLWLQVVDGFAEKHEVKTSEDDGLGMEDVPDD